MKRKGYFNLGKDLSDDSYIMKIVRDVHEKYKVKRANISLFGQSQVGKTCFLKTLCSSDDLPFDEMETKEVSEGHGTVTFKIYEIPYKDEEIRVRIIDTWGWIPGNKNYQNGEFIKTLKGEFPPGTEMNDCIGKKSLINGDLIVDICIFFLSYTLKNVSSSKELEGMKSFISKAKEMGKKVIIVVPMMDKLYQMEKKKSIFGEYPVTKARNEVIAETEPIKEKISKTIKDSRIPIKFLINYKHEDSTVHDIVKVLMKEFVVLLGRTISKLNSSSLKEENRAVMDLNEFFDVNNACISSYEIKGFEEWKSEKSDVELSQSFLKIQFFNLIKLGNRVFRFAIVSTMEKKFNVVVYNPILKYAFNCNSYFGGLVKVCEKIFEKKEDVPRYAFYFLENTGKEPNPEVDSECMGLRISLNGESLWLKRCDFGNFHGLVEGTIQQLKTTKKLQSELIQKMKELEELKVETINDICLKTNEMRDDFKKTVNNTIENMKKEDEEKFKGSVILNKDQQKKLFGWVQVSTYMKKFHLIYKATRDGMNSTSFHQKCDGHSPTVVVILSDDGSIFGGFTNLGWGTSGADYCDLSSFLFCLKRVNDKNGYKMLPKRTDNHVNHTLNYGPTFGGNHDIYVHQNFGGGSYTNVGHSFYVPAGKSVNLSGKKNFSVKEMEVFELK